MRKGMLPRRLPRFCTALVRQPFRQGTCSTKMNMYATQEVSERQCRLSQGSTRVLFLSFKSQLYYLRRLLTLHVSMQPVLSPMRQVLSPILPFLW